MMQDEIIERLERIERLLDGQAPKPLTFLEACQYLDCSKSHLYKLTSTGGIRHYKPNGKRIFFRKSDLDGWLLRNPIKTTAQIEQEAVDAVTIRKRGRR